MKYVFEIPGNPVPQKQTRFFKVGDGIHAYDPSKKDKENIIKQILKDAPKVPLACPIEMTIVFHLPIPKSARKSIYSQMVNGEIFPDKKPDEDNLAYLVTNALKKIVYDDDARICAKHVYKYYSTVPKTIIIVRPLITPEGDETEHW